jgi:hypothetical protein
MLLVQRELAAYREGIALLALEVLRFIDESGTNLAMIRQYERATKGERRIGVIPCTTVSICRCQVPSDPTDPRRS